MKSVDCKDCFIVYHVFGRQKKETNLGQLDGILDVVIITTQISLDSYKICGYWKLRLFYERF